MEILIGVLIAVFSGILLFVFLLWQKSRTAAVDPAADKGLVLIQNQIQEISRTLDAKLTESRLEMQDAVRTQFSESKRLLTEINSEMSKNLVEVAKEQTKTNEATRQFVTIAEQIGNLEKVLKNQKQRGNLGEASLELILSNVLPPTAYKMQYEFQSGEKVDAAVLTKEGIIPVDAKFPLENYVRVMDEVNEERRAEYAEAFRKDVKKRVDETAKYVRPNEGTLPFAFMYIPAESIYYDLLNSDANSKVSINSRSLLEYAQHEKKVIMVSPTTFSAYLQSVLYGFKAFRIEETAKDIIKRVDELGKHLKAYEDYYKKIGSSLSTTVNHYNAGYKELGKVDKDITRIAGVSPELEPVLLDRPLLGDE